MYFIKFILILFLGFNFLSSYAQINVKKVTSEDPNQIRPTYDSLSGRIQSFTKEDRPKYLQYVGQKLCFKPLSNKQKEKLIIHEFVIAEGINVEAKVLVPFEETSQGKILSLMLNNASVMSAQQVSNIKKKIEESKANYNQTINSFTQIYKPIFIDIVPSRYGRETVPRFGTNYESLENKTFLVLDVFNNHDIKALKRLTYDKDVYNNGEVLFKLLDEKGDTLYWKTWECENKIKNQFLIQGFYDKQVSLYKNDTLVYRQVIPDEYLISNQDKAGDPFALKNINQTDVCDVFFPDINTREQIKMTNLSNWICSDITLIEDSDDYNLYYILKNQTGNEIKIPIGKLDHNKFILKKNHQAEMCALKIQKEEYLAKRAKEKIEMQKTLAARKQSLIKKYGQKNGLLIFDGQVALGMTKEMCIEAWGSTRSIVRNNIVETWLYDYQNALTFNGNKLIQIVKL